MLRWSVTPFLLFLLLPLNVLLLLMKGLAGDSCTLYGVLLVLQILFYVLGLWGYYLSTKQIKNKLLFIPYYFLLSLIHI